MRGFIFAICTTLSIFGFFVAFSLPPVFPSCAECLSHHQRNVLAAGFAFHIVMLASALIAYFRMGIAWALDRRLGLFWPVFGTVAATLTLAGVGMNLNGVMGPDFGLARLGMVVTAPAILLSIWMVVFHARRAKRGAAR
ncbi:hypothetical protein [Dyella sp. ASV21]|uniref:hypothetical protein n=1 Tax=Dyella sp. ASV21 TaxID=2795114 RepID=UPI0018EA9194|nr:hypothetical protein [Dyella sp. ASV21]